MSTMTTRVGLAAVLLMPAAAAAQGPTLECAGALTGSGVCRATVAVSDSMQHQELLLKC